MTNGELLRIVSERDALLVAATELLRVANRHQDRSNIVCEAWDELEQAVASCLGQVRDSHTGERVRRPR
jgi:hypothetical protein